MTRNASYWGQSHAVSSIVWPNPGRHGGVCLGAALFILWPNPPTGTSCGVKRCGVHVGIFFVKTWELVRGKATRNRLNIYRRA